MTMNTCIHCDLSIPDGQGVNGYCDHRCHARALLARAVEIIPPQAIEGTATVADLSAYIDLIEADRGA